MDWSKLDKFLSSRKGEDPDLESNLRLVKALHHWKTKGAPPDWMRDMLNRWVDDLQKQYRF